MRVAASGRESVTSMYVVLMGMLLGVVNNQVWAIRELTWSPSGDYDWKDSSNWSGPSGQYPDDDEDKAIFPTKGSIGDPILDGNLNGTGGGLGQLVFNGAGWTVSNEAGEDNTINLVSANYFSNNAIYSSGAGTNRIKPKVAFLQTGLNVYTGENNLLVLEQVAGPYAFVVSSLNPTAANTGSIRLEGNNSSLSNAFLIRQGTLLVANAGALGASTSTIYFADNWTVDGANARLLTDAAVTVSKRLEVRNLSGHQVNATIGGNQTTGASQFTNTVVVNLDTRLTSANTDGNPVYFTGGIGGSAGIIKTGPGTVSIGGTLSYAGQTRVEQGRLMVNGTTLPTGTNVTLANVSGAVLDLLSNSQTIGSLDGGGGSGGAVWLGSAQLTVSSGTFAGSITGSGGSLRKTSTGTLTLSGNNSYTGTTTVTEGWLLVNGTHTGGGVYTVNSTGKLGGTGTIGTSITVQSGGLLSPGASIESLDVVGSVGLGGTLKIEVSGSGNGLVDLLNVSGILDIRNATVDFDVLSGLDDPAYVFARYGTLSGSAFAQVIDLPQGYTIDYNYMGGNQIALVIPEPTALCLLALSGLFLVWRRCRVTAW